MAFIPRRALRKDLQQGVSLTVRFDKCFSESKPETHLGSSKPLFNSSMRSNTDTPQMDVYTSPYGQGLISEVYFNAMHMMHMAVL